MRDIFVETNWVVAVAAPSYYRAASPEASELLERAARGEVRLHLPSICIAESRRTIATRFEQRDEARVIRNFLRWATAEAYLAEPEFQNALAAVSRMQSSIKRDLRDTSARLLALRAAPGLFLFELSNDSMQLCTNVSFLELNLQPFDQMILAAILNRARELKDEGARDINFCELDADLQPWTKKRGEPKEPLTSLYDKGEVWVYNDFTAAFPPRPVPWPETSALA